eukprot:TRINITY_DN7687_c0_g1_i1.p1 TRINITY_DN7687_c0_g1~~TRINITY_DN7687_c0_g1_i1.p1  ORF type:complete len:499 (-),score=77.37 TRINITY_DN7687_c0_g1_i1:36-1505(-)
MADVSERAQLFDDYLNLCAVVPALLREHANRSPFSITPIPEDALRGLDVSDHTGRVHAQLAVLLLRQKRTYEAMLIALHAVFLSHSPCCGLEAQEAARASAQQVARDGRVGPAGLRIEWAPRRGFGLFTADPVPPAAELLDELPVLVMAVGTFCARCLKQSQPELGCDVCKAAWCCEACRGADGLRHESLCKLLNAGQAFDRWDEEAFALLHFVGATLLYLRRHLPLAYAQVLAQCESPLDDEEEAQCRGIHQLLVDTGGASQGVELRHVQSLARKFKANGFGLLQPFNPGTHHGHEHEHDDDCDCDNEDEDEEVDPNPFLDRSCRGYAVYPLATLANHSCLPNTARCDDPDQPRDPPFNLAMSLRALHELPPNTEVLLSYLPLGTPLEIRRERTLLTYGFECDCFRCQTEALMEAGESAAPAEVVESEETEGRSYVAAFMLKYLCQQCGGNLVPLPNSQDMRCNVCGGVRTEAEFQQMLNEDSDEDCD